MFYVIFMSMVVFFFMISCFKLQDFCNLLKFAVAEDGADNQCYRELAEKCEKALVMRHQGLDNKPPTSDISKHNQSIPHKVANKSSINENNKLPASKFRNEKKTYKLTGSISCGDENLQSISNKNNSCLNPPVRIPPEIIANGIFFAQPITVINDADNTETSSLSSQTITNPTKEKSQFR